MMTDKALPPIQPPADAAPLMRLTSATEPTFTTYLTGIVEKAVDTQLRRWAGFLQAQERRATPEGRTYTISDCCAIAHVSKATFYHMVERGLIQPRKVGRRTYVLADEFDRMIEAGEIKRYGRAAK